MQTTYLQLFAHWSSTVFPGYSTLFFLCLQSFLHGVKYCNGADCSSLEICRMRGVIIFKKWLFSVIPLKSCSAHWLLTQPHNSGTSSIFLFSPHPFYLLFAPHGSGHRGHNVRRILSEGGHLYLALASLTLAMANWLSHDLPVWYSSPLHQSNKVTLGKCFIDGSKSAKCLEVFDVFLSIRQLHHGLGDL